METEHVPLPFTCITCRVSFSDAEMQRSHYKTDWHRYNLKRKVAQMPPVTAEVFFERVMSQRAQAESSAKAAVPSYCAVCNKHFNSESQYDNHVQSKKHKEAKAKEERKPIVERLNKKNKDLTSTSTIKTSTENDANNSKFKNQMESSSTTDSTRDVDDASEDDSCEEWDGDALGLEECLFCSYVGSSMEANIKHMTKSHSFFIPDIDYICDLEGLMSYLGEKVGEGHICLWCNERSKTFLSTQAVQKHMIDKGHCKMLFDGDAVFEYSDYYDYRSSYPDFDPDSEQMDTDDGSESVQSDSLDGSGYELVLPSGAVIGHRTLQRYYRQKLKPDRRPNTAALTRALAQYKALGWTGTSGLVAKKRAKDIGMVQRMKKRHYISLAIKANKFQPHFRPQVVF